MRKNSSIHKLKILPAYYSAVRSGDKSFEVRDNSDRGFQKGDRVVFIEFGVKEKRKNIYAEITYVTNYHQKKDYVVFGFKKLGKEVKTSDED